MNSGHVSDDSIQSNLQVTIASQTNRPKEMKCEFKKSKFYIKSSIIPTHKTRSAVAAAAAASDDDDDDDVWKASRQQLNKLRQ